MTDPINNIEAKTVRTAKKTFFTISFVAALKLFITFFIHFPC
ncbi:hypothetical protein LOT_2285 [Lentilactobacillus otakiensis DSM 19908 = JCM 15040]|uniref:Uncharacterized protein n=1 Tax=Lentilactobacillus otakiensis DSM 19908 = JCM 15040 TaxID=1423780 RepID=S4NKC5_9LACO|nr:hypothetical protein LOT_2285 [Lentilactobacillus otakiensis DSM 19908 = JCM 15040]